MKALCSIIVGLFLGYVTADFIVKALAAPPPDQQPKQQFVIDQQPTPAKPVVVEVPVTAEVVADPPKGENVAPYMAGDGYYYCCVNGQWKRYEKVPTWVNVDKAPPMAKLVPEPAGHYEWRQECQNGQCRRYKVWVPDQSSNLPRDDYCQFASASSCDCVNCSCTNGQCGAADCNYGRRRVFGRR